MDANTGPRRRLRGLPGPAASAVIRGIAPAAGPLSRGIQGGGYRDSPGRPTAGRFTGMPPPHAATANRRPA
jgi:hypothetical protein